jgi:polar amino acid transport system substrate-binding protein
MRKGETAFINKVNEVLAGMEKSGEAAKIFDHYLGAGTQYNLHRTFRIEPIKG